MSCFGMYRQRTVSPRVAEMRREQFAEEEFPLGNIYEMDLQDLSAVLSAEQRDTLASLRKSKETPDGAIYFLMAAQIVEQMNLDPEFADNPLKLTDLGVTFERDEISEKYGAFIAYEDIDEVSAEAAAFLEKIVEANQYFADALKRKLHDELVARRQESREAIRAQLAQTGRVFSFQSALMIADNWKTAGYEVRIEGITDDPVAMLEKGVRIVGRKGDEEREVVFMPNGNVWVHADATAERHGEVSDKVAREVRQILFGASFTTGAPIVMQTVQSGRRNPDGTSLPLEENDLSPRQETEVNRSVEVDHRIWDRPSHLKT